MGNTDVWPVIHAERRALADELEGIGEEGWSTRSLCSDWTVRDVLAAWPYKPPMWSGNTVRDHACKGRCFRSCWP